MRNFIFIFSIVSLSLPAKEVYFADADGVKTSETADPSIKLWYLKNYVFGMGKIDPNRFALGIKTSKGFTRPNVEDALEQFGESRDGPVLFHIVPFDKETGELGELTRVKFVSDCKPIAKECKCPETAPAATLPAPAAPPVAEGILPAAPVVVPVSTPPAAEPPAAPSATPPAAVPATATTPAVPPAATTAATPPTVSPAALPAATPTPPSPVSPTATIPAAAPTTPAGA